jgi:hypothetical protein
VAVFYVSLAEGTVKRGDMACDTAPDDESRCNRFRVVNVRGWICDISNRELVKPRRLKAHLLPLSRNENM